MGRNETNRLETGQNHFEIRWQNAEKLTLWTNTELLLFKRDGRLEISKAPEVCVAKKLPKDLLLYWSREGERLNKREPWTVVFFSYSASKPGFKTLRESISSLAHKPDQKRTRSHSNLNEPNHRHRRQH